MRRYAEALRRIDGLQLQAMTADVEPIVWAIAMRLDGHAFPQGRDSVAAALAEHGIETRPGFCAASGMPHLYATSDIPVSEALGSDIISLPSSPIVSDDEIDFIAARLAALARP